MIEEAKNQSKGSWEPLKLDVDILHPQALSTLPWLASPVCSCLGHICVRRASSFHHCYCWLGLRIGFLIFIYFMCMDVLFVCMPVYHLCPWYQQRPEESIVSPKSGVRDWATVWVLGINSCPLDKQPVLLATKSPLQPQNSLFLLQPWFAIRSVPLKLITGHGKINEDVFYHEDEGLWGSLALPRWRNLSNKLGMTFWRCLGPWPTVFWAKGPSLYPQCHTAGAERRKSTKPPGCARPWEHQAVWASFRQGKAWFIVSCSLCHFWPACQQCPEALCGDFVSCWFCFR